MNGDEWITLRGRRTAGRGGLVFEAHRRLHHSTPDLRVIKKRRESPEGREEHGGQGASGGIGQHLSLYIYTHMTRARARSLSLSPGAGRHAAQGLGGVTQRGGRAEGRKERGGQGASRGFSSGVTNANRAWYKLNNYVQGMFQPASSRGESYSAQGETYRRQGGARRGRRFRGSRAARAVHT